MIFTRQFKFYASHRNQHLKDKCACLHGHRYEVTYEIELWRNNRMGQDVTILFADLDVINNHVREIFDHSCMLDWMDPLAMVLSNFVETDSTKEHWKFAFLPFPTSAENLAFTIFNLIELLINKHSLSCKIKTVNLRETDSTLVTYDEETWKNDCSLLEKYQRGNDIFWPKESYVSNSSLKTLYENAGFISSSSNE